MLLPNRSKPATSSALSRVVLADMRNIEGRTGDHRRREHVGTDDVAHAGSPARLGSPARGLRHRIAVRGPRSRPPTGPGRRRTSVLLDEDATSMSNCMASNRYGPGNIVLDDAAGHRCRGQGIPDRPRVHGELGAQAPHRPVVHRRSLDGDLFVTGLAAEHEVLVAVLDPLDRSTEAQRGSAQGDVLTQHRRPFRSERTADVARHDARRRSWALPSIRGVPG